MSAWLAEDPELLQTAFEIIDSWDEEGEASASESASSDRVDSSQECEASPCHVAPMRARVEERTTRSLGCTHRRRREEIRELRGQLAELERHIAELQQSKTPTSETQSNPMHARVWRDIALRERQLRVAAESSRANLRRYVDAQVKIARGLTRLVQKAKRLERGHTLRPMPTPAIVDAGPVQVDEIGQRVRLYEMHKTADALFVHPKFRDGTARFLDIQLHTDRSDQLAVEVCEAWTVPFDQHRTMDALWSFSVGKLRDKLCGAELLQDAKVRIDDTEIVSNFSAIVSLTSAQAKFDGRAIAQRFPQEHSHIPPLIVSNMWCTPNLVSPGSFTGIRAGDESCLRVLPVDTNRSETAVAMSRVQFCQRFTIEFLDQARRCEDADTLTTTMMHTLRNCINAMHETVETVLLLTGK